MTGSASSRLAAAAWAGFSGSGSSCWLRWVGCSSSMRAAPIAVRRARWRRRFLPGSLVGDHHRGRLVGHRLARGLHGIVFGVEILPPKMQARRGRLNDGFPRLPLIARGSLPVHVDEDCEIVVMGIEPPLIEDHGQPELMQHEKFLRQVVMRGEAGQPVADAINLGYADTADLPQRQLAWL